MHVPVAEGCTDRQYPQSGDMGKLSSWHGSMSIPEPTPTFQPQAKRIMQIFLSRTKCPNEMNLSFHQTFSFPNKQEPTRERPLPPLANLLPQKYQSTTKNSFNILGDLFVPVMVLRTKNTSMSEKALLLMDLLF